MSEVSTTMSMDEQKGFTLVELLITMVVVSILLATHEFHTVAHLCDAHLSLESGKLHAETVDTAGAERKIIPYG